MKKTNKTSVKKKTVKKIPPVKEISVSEVASEIIYEFISLLNLFTLYKDKGAKCILSGEGNENVVFITDVI